MPATILVIGTLDTKTKELGYLRERIEKDAVERLAKLRKNRDPSKVSELLTRLEVAAHSAENLLPLFIECVDNDLTLGEICALLRQEWGEYTPSG